MIYSDILRRLRYALNITDAILLEIFALGKMPIFQERIDCMLKKDEEPGFIECSNAEMHAFLNGFIIKRRGAKDTTETKTSTDTRLPHLSNNDILKALRIALALKDIDIIEIMNNAKVTVSKSEINALFRKKGQDNYKQCGDQFLRSFISGLNYKHREQ